MNKLISSLALVGMFLPSTGLAFDVVKHDEKLHIVARLDSGTLEPDVKVVQYSTRIEFCAANPTALGCEEIAERVRRSMKHFRVVYKPAVLCKRDNKDCKAVEGRLQTAGYSL